MEIQISHKIDPQAQKEGLVVIASTPGDKPTGKTKVVIYESLSDEEKDIVDKFRSFIKSRVA